MSLSSAFNGDSRLLTIQYYWHLKKFNKPCTELCLSVDITDDDDDVSDDIGTWSDNMDENVVDWTEFWGDVEEISFVP